LRSGQSRDGLTLGHQRALLRLLEPIGVKEGGEAASPMPLAPRVRHPRVAKGLLDPRPAIGEKDIPVRVGEPPSRSVWIAAQDGGGPATD